MIATLKKDYYLHSKAIHVIQRANGRDMCPCFVNARLEILEYGNQLQCSMNI